jgi:3-deoxy-D-manno-octulosonic-acid transferase
MHNFGRISSILTKKGGGISVRDSRELAEKLKELLKNRHARESAGMAAFEVILENQGALKRTYGEIMSAVNNTV